MKILAKDTWYQKTWNTLKDWLSKMTLSFTKIGNLYDSMTDELESMTTTSSMNRQSEEEPDIEDAMQILIELKKRVEWREKIISQTAEELDKQLDIPMLEEKARSASEKVQAAVEVMSAKQKKFKGVIFRVMEKVNRGGFRYAEFRDKLHKAFAYSLEIDKQIRELEVESTGAAKTVKKLEYDVPEMTEEELEKIRKRKEKEEKKEEAPAEKVEGSIDKKSDDEIKVGDEVVIENEGYYSGDGKIKAIEKWKDGRMMVAVYFSGKGTVWYDKSMIDFKKKEEAPVEKVEGSIDVESDRDSNLIIDWVVSSPSTVASFKEFGLFGDVYYDVDIENADGTVTWYAKVDGVRYIIDNDTGTYKRASLNKESEDPYAHELMRIRTMTSDQLSTRIRRMGLEKLKLFIEILETSNITKNLPALDLAALDKERLLGEAKDRLSKLQSVESSLEKKSMAIGEVYSYEEEGEKKTISIQNITGDKVEILDYNMQRKELDKKELEDKLNNDELHKETSMSKKSNYAGDSADEVLRNTEIKDFECTRCFKKFRTMYSDQPIQCPQCGNWLQQGGFVEKKAVVDPEKYKLYKESREWKLIIDLKDSWGKYKDMDDEELEENIGEAGKEVAKILRDIKDYDKLEEDADAVKEEIESIADNFEYVESVDDFNEYMNDLYDLGDNYSIWINLMNT